MTYVDLFAKDALDPLGMDSMPDDQQTARIRVRCQELVNATARLERAEALVDAIKARKNLLEMRLLPTMFDTVMTDSIGLPEAGVDIVVQPFVQASIPVDWEEDRRVRAFGILEKLGGGDLVQATVEVRLPKEELKLAQLLQNHLTEFLKKAYEKREALPPAVKLVQAVHWGTLTSWLKEYLTQREEAMAEGIPVPVVDFKDIGATIGRICKIKKRKIDKPKSGKRRK